MNPGLLTCEASTLPLSYTPSAREWELRAHISDFILCSYVICVEINKDNPMHVTERKERRAICFLQLLHPPLFKVPSSSPLPQHLSKVFLLCLMFCSGTIEADNGDIRNCLFPHLSLSKQINK